MIIMKNDENVFDLNLNRRFKWVNEIKELLGEDSTDNVIQFCLSYTLQSLRFDQNEVNKFKWDNNCW